MDDGHRQAGRFPWGLPEPCPPSLTDREANGRSARGVLGRSGCCAYAPPAFLRRSAHPSAQNANDTEADTRAGPTEGVESVKKEDVQEAGGDLDGGSV